MSGFIGSAADLKWTWGATGTIQLNVDYRNFSYTPSINLLEDTAGADTGKSYVPSFKDGNATFSGLLQAGSAPAWGSAFCEGTAGTLYWSPEGTSGGKFKQTIPAMSQGVVITAAYNDLVAVSLSWLQNGARTDGTN